MSELTKCLQTQSPRVVNFPSTITLPSSPVDWALKMFESGAIEAALQISSPNINDGTVTHLDETDPASLQQFISRTQNGQPVHGSLKLIDFCAEDGTMRDNSDWAWDVFSTEFRKALTQRHPLGYYTTATLWTSCGNHRYAVHCDLADGFLVHLCGRKQVRVWPVPYQYQKEMIFNYGDFEGRMKSEPIQFDLEPGQILFIPAGAMHEVVAEGSDPAVSISYHMGSPFPLLALRDQLNKMLKQGEISLPEEMCSTKKFDLFFFEPSRFIKKGDSDREMPRKLAKALSRVFQSRLLDRGSMLKLLNQWWRIAIKNPIYPGPYP
jgi:hypothetical protein